MNINKICVAVALAMTMSCTRVPETVVGVRTEALDDASWGQSEWISVVDAPVVRGSVSVETRAADGASWFATTLKNEQKVTSAKWMATGLGVFDLYVNGHLVGNEILKPGFTHYKKTRLSFTYDITEAFSTKAGAENVLAAQVTPGWWADKIVTAYSDDGMIGKKCAFRGVLELTYADGTKAIYGTNTTDWKAGIAGPVTHAAIFDGEEYDARLQPGYACMDSLSTPEVNTEFSGEIVPSDGGEVYRRYDLAMNPMKAYVWTDVEGATEEAYGKVVIDQEFTAGEQMVLHPGQTLVVDFGQNCAAVPSFLFKAEEGTQLTCLPAELLNDGNGAKSRGMDGPEGSVHRKSLRIGDTGMILKYTFARTRGDVEYTPRRTFFGYRALSITATGDVTIKSVKSVPVTSFTQEMEIGNLTTGNEQVNRLYQNSLWSARSNCLSLLTDCPQRNERLGWTGSHDLTETTTFFAHTADFFRKWTRDMRDSQSETGAYPAVAPFGQAGSDPTDMMRVGWCDAGVTVPWTVWKQFGCTTIVDENWEAMEKFMNHVNETKYDHTALSAENRNYQFGDWLSYEPLESCSWGAFDSQGNAYPETLFYWNFLCASYWMSDAAKMRDMAVGTGRDVAKYEKMVEDARDYLLSNFLNEDGTFKVELLNTMQTPALFALKNNLLEGEALEAMKARLRENFARHDNCLQTGFLGTAILLNTLTENGMVDIAYELLFQHKNPSWLYMVDNGATTIWERWDSYTTDRGLASSGMNSFNHYALGYVGEWMWKTMCGIASDPVNPGFKHIIMKPVPDKRLGFVNATYNSAAGPIHSEWKYEGDKWIWKFTIPKDATATVTLPGETESKEYEAGSYTIEQ